jgi:hypothetical protein
MWVSGFDLKALDKDHAIWHSGPWKAFSESRVVMQKSLFAIASAAFSVVLLSTSAAYCGSYPFGDEPYRLNWGYDPAVESGCLKWNWQQYQWNDFCAVYVNPKAYMYPRSSRMVLRTKG